MDIVKNGYLLKVVVLFVTVMVRETECQDYSWIGSSSLTPAILPCSDASTQLELKWTYTPENPVPDIEWSKRNSVGGFDKVASLLSGSLTINPKYTSRFKRTGATGEIAIKNATETDAGVYKVVITDSLGRPLDGEANATVEYVVVGTVKPKCRASGDVGFTMTCSGEDEPNIPANCMELRKDGVLLSGTVENGILSIFGKDIDNANITCSLCGTMLQCLPEPSTDTCPDCQPCKKSGIAFLVITVSSIVIGIVAIIVVKMLKSAILRLTLYIVGAVWIAFGLMGTITVFAICAQVQPEDVLPCGSMTIASASFSVITLVGGVVTIILAVLENTPPISPHPQDQPLKPINTAPTDVTSSQPVNSSSSQGRPSLGPVQSSRGPKSQAGNASLRDSENPESSRVTSASNVNAQVIVQHEATQQGEGNQTEKQKSKKKKKKKMKVSEEVGEKPS